MHKGKRESPYLPVLLLSRIFMSILSLLMTPYKFFYLFCRFLWLNYKDLFFIASYLTARSLIYLVDQEVST